MTDPSASNMNADPRAAAWQLDDAPIIEFGPFRFDPVRREVSDERGPVRLGSRALEILGVLLETPGRLFTREEIVARVWPRSVVEDTSLRVHMSALRRALGDGLDGVRYIDNVPGRGYVFVGPTRASARPAGEPGRAEGAIEPRLPEAQSPASRSTSLLPRLTRPIGRDEVIGQLVELLAVQRLVSIVGAGGMGKTTVASAVAEQLRHRYEHGVHFVDLSRISSPGLVASELWHALGYDGSLVEPVLMLQRTLQHQRLLIVMDNCEHVIDAAARLIDTLTRTCPGVRFLATSREPLEVEAEWVLKLAPLAVPSPLDTLGVEDLLGFPAIQLFSTRARALCDSFELDEGNAPAVRALCAALDGIPLAIELAAARVDSLGPQGLLKRIENVFELLTRGRRTALSRHRTLNAVLAWSYELLSEREQRTLQRLSVFRGAFDLDGAVAVASYGGSQRHEIIDDVLSLCSKSLVASQLTEDGSTRHRLLYITRLYAERRLEGSAESDECHRRHAEFIDAALLRVQEAGLGMSEYHWSPALGSSIADVSAAIDWALVMEHDLVLGMKLTINAMRPYRDAGRVEEFRQLVDMALRKLHKTDAAGRDPLELHLRVAYAFMSTYQLDGGAGQREAFARTRQLAACGESVEDRIEALLGMCVGALGQGDYRLLMDLCTEARGVTTGVYEPLSGVVTDRLTMMALHALGHHEAAEQLGLRVLAHDGGKLGRRFLSEVPVAVSVGLQLARIRWLRGSYRHAWETLERALDATRGVHFFARLQVLALSAIPLAFWRGDHALALQWTQELQALSSERGMVYWQAYAAVYGRLAAGQPLRVGSEEYLLAERCAMLKDFASTLQTARPSASMLARVEAGEVGWCAPEVLRLSVLEQLVQDNAAVCERAAAGLQAALDTAERQGARFWMLRIALTLCTPGSGARFKRDPMVLLDELVSAAQDEIDIPELIAARRLLGHR